MKNKRFAIIIENISEGKETGYCVRLPDLHDSIVLGENFEEIAKGIKMTFEAENKKCDPALLNSIKACFGKTSREDMSFKLHGSRV